MSNLTQRIVFGLPLALIALSALYFGGLFWLSLLTVTAILMSFEWVKLVQLENWKITAVSVAIITSVVLQISFFYQAFLGFLVLPGLALVMIFTGFLTGLRALKHLGYGSLYIGLPLLSLLWLRSGENMTGLVVTLWLILIIWSTDVFAYFTGRTFGGPKIFPIISPKKTWSGFVGGLVGAALASLAVQFYFSLSEFAWGLIPLALFVSVIGQLGDALESSIKRQFDVKDSGNLIPGHGGLFDRLDAFLVAAPIVSISLILADTDIMSLVGDIL